MPKKGFIVGKVIFLSLQIIKSLELF